MTFDGKLHTCIFHHYGFSLHVSFVTNYLSLLSVGVYQFDCYTDASLMYKNQDELGQWTLSMDS